MTNDLPVNSSVKSHNMYDEILLDNKFREWLLNSTRNMESCCNDNQTKMDELYDVVVHVLSFIDLTTLAKTIFVNKTWHCASRSNEIWLSQCDKFHTLLVTKFSNANIPVQLDFEPIAQEQSGEFAVHRYCAQFHIQISKNVAHTLKKMQRKKKYRNGAIKCLGCYEKITGVDDLSKAEIRRICFTVLGYCVCCPCVLLYTLK
jgi:hypothetical protein